MVFGLFGATADAFPFVFVQGRLRYGSRSSCCGLFLVFRRFRRQRFAFFCACERSVFRPFGTRFRWCSAFSAPLPTRSLLCLFRVGCATVQGPAAAAFSLSLKGSVGNVSAFFALGRFGTRFRLCSVFSAPLPTRFLLRLFRVGCATVQGPAAAAFSLSLEGSKGDVSTPGGTLANGAFLAVV